MEKNIIGRPIVEHLDARVYNLTGHTPKVHAQRTYVKERHIRYNSWTTHPVHEVTFWGLT